MWESSPSVRDGAGADAYAGRPVLDTALLQAIHDVNASFLRHASAILPDDCVGQLAAVLELPGPVRAIAAQCPYTLFDLRFQDGAYWRSVAAETRPALPLSGSAGAFGRAAVFLAWFLVRSGGLAAPIMLGMAPAVTEIWRELPVSDLDHVAGAVLPQLTGRWADHSRFWPALARAAQAGNAQQLTDVRLLGMQLLAADSVRAGAPAATARRGRG